jgi:AAA domain
MATEAEGLTAQEFEAGMFDLTGATEYKNIMVYGGPGAGKTVLAGSAPGRILFLAGEPGYISAARLGAQGRARLIPDSATAVAAVSWLEDGNASKFDFIVTDGLGTIQNKALLSYAAEAWDANPAKRVHRNLPDKPDYFNAQNFIKSWVARLVDLPCHTIFTAHAMFPEDKETGDQLVYPAIQGKGYEVSSYVCGMMHAVGYMSPRIKQTEDGPIQVRRILWQSQKDPKTDTTYFAKDQFDALGVYTDVNRETMMMPQILEIIDSGHQNEAPANLIVPPVAVKKAAAGRRRVPARR